MNNRSETWYPVYVTFVTIFSGRNLCFAHQYQWQVHSGEIDIIACNCISIGEVMVEVIYEGHKLGCMGIV